MNSSPQSLPVLYCVVVVVVLLLPIFGASEGKDRAWGRGGCHLHDAWNTSEWVGE